MHINFRESKKLKLYKNIIYKSQVNIKYINNWEIDIMK